MIADILKSIKSATDEPGVKTTLKDMLDPMFSYVDAKVSSVTFFFQIIAILILIQSLAIVFLVILEIKRNI